MCRTGTALSDSTQKNAFTDDSPSASEDDDDALTDTVNEGSKHIVLGDREAEERIQRARDARKEFFESEHNTTVESYSSKRDDFENEDEQSDNEDILMDDPENLIDHDEEDKSASRYPKANTSDAGKANKEKVVSAERERFGVGDRSREKAERGKLTGDGKESLSLVESVEKESQNKQETGPLDSKDTKYGHSRTAKNKQQTEEPDKRQEAVKSGKSRTGSVGGRGGDGEGAKSCKGRRESGGRESGGEGAKSGKGRRESGGSSRSGANSSSSASEGNKQ